MRKNSATAASKEADSIQLQRYQKILEKTYFVLFTKRNYRRIISLVSEVNRWDEKVSLPALRKERLMKSGDIAMILILVLLIVVLAR